MNYFEDIYKKRVNRYGTNYQDRILNQRIESFQRYLLKSIYRVDFLYNEEEIPGSLERYKQDETETMQYLLVNLDVIIPPGTVLEITDSNGITHHWMIYWLEIIKTSGYNRYVVLKMSHFIKWLDSEKNEHESWAYMYGQENNMLKDEIRSRSRMDTIYSENLKSSFFVMPKTPYIKKDVYLEIGEEPYLEAYRVTGYDIQSTEGVEYVTIDPVYIRDKTPAPQPTPGEEDDEDFFWLQGNGGDLQ